MTCSICHSDNPPLLCFPKVTPVYNFPFPNRPSVDWLKPHIRAMNLEVTDEQAAALTRELSDIVKNDRYPLSPRIVALKEILGQLRPEPARAAATARSPRIYAPPTKGRWRPRRG